MNHLLPNHFQKFDLKQNKKYSKKIKMFENAVVFGLLAGTEEVFLKVASGEMDGEYQVPESCSDRFDPSVSRCSDPFLFSSLPFQ